MLKWMFIITILFIGKTLLLLYFNGQNYNEYDQQDFDIHQYDKLISFEPYDPIKIKEINQSKKYHPHEEKEQNMYYHYQEAIHCYNIVIIMEKEHDIQNNLLQ